MVFNVSESKERKTVTKEDLPHQITKWEDVVIPMSDGCKLYAHIWIPKEALKEGSGLKLGTLVEYIPYRKNDFTAIRDSIRHPYYAGHGFASIRVDMRGCGDSDGLLYDEYLKQEQDDCLEVFDWIIKQNWSNENIGMFGKSWGGFNCLQLAARQHPALKAVITLMSTDDRYSDDVHYRGGAMLASDMLWWASTMFAYTQRPQDPAIVGESWRENWLERLKIPPNSIAWISHQTRDEYWKHGSICENDYQDVKIPVLAIGGWRDGYTSPVFRMIENLPNKESKGIVGPWVHEYPEVATPHPGIGYNQLAVSWWSKYLNGGSVDMNLHQLSAYIQEPSSISDSYSSRPGAWVGLNYGDRETLDYVLDTTSKTISTTYVTSPNQPAIEFSGTQEHGLFRGSWCPFGQPGDFPTDQKIEDYKCLTFDSIVNDSENDIEILGIPKLNVTVSSNKSNAILSARLVDIYPTGEHVLVSWGMLNLSHRTSHEFPESLKVNEKYEVTITMDALGIKLAKGHKLRLALSPTDWPSAWPLAEVPDITIYSGTLKLPIVNEKIYSTDVKFEKPESMKPCDREILRGDSRSREVKYNVIDNTWIIEDISDEGMRRLPNIGNANGIEMGSLNKNIWVINPSDPLSAYNECNWELTVGRGDWQTKVVTNSSLKADKNNFHLHNKLIAYEGTQKVHEQIWDNSIPRNFC